MKVLISLIILLTSMTVMAQSESVHCETPRALHQFVLHENSIEILNSRDLQGASRSPAAVANLINRSSGENIIRVAQHDGHRFRFEFRFSTEGNFQLALLRLRNRQGHEMTYPLNCQPQAL
jgi:hypothetical protein